jgi:ABC-type phosphate/phosphonate transport system substrate-binding protein
MTAAPVSLPASGSAFLPTYDVASSLACGSVSAIIVRAQEPAETLAALRDRRCVVNDETVLNAAVEVQGLAFFGSVHLSGSHRQSVEMVAGYEADVAAIDSSALAHLRSLYPALLEKVRVLCWTPE